MAQTSWWDDFLNIFCDKQCACKKACEAELYYCPEALNMCKDACKKKATRPASGTDFLLSLPVELQLSCEALKPGADQRREAFYCERFPDSPACVRPGVEGLEANQDKDPNTAIYIVFAVIIISLILYLIFS